MKNPAFLLVSMVLMTACMQRNKFHLPRTPARFLVEVRVTPGNGSTVGQALKTLEKLALERLEAAGITYQSVETDEASGTMRFRLIDGPSIAPGKTANYDAAYFQDAIVPHADLEFWDVYRATDKGVSEPFQQLQQNPLLANHIEWNVRGYNRSESFGHAPDLEKPLIDSVLALPEIKKLFPSDLEFKLSEPDYLIRIEQAHGKRALYALKTGNKAAPLSHKDLTDAVIQPEQRTGETMIYLQFNEPASVVWEEMTRRASEDGNRGIAIVLNGEILTVPMVMNPITEGKSSILGNFSFKEALDLALQLKMTMTGHEMTLLKTEAL